MCSIIRVKSMASSWSGQNEDICPSIKKSMTYPTPVVICEEFVLWNKGILHKYRWHFQYHLPTSSCQRSLWMPPSHIFSFFAQSDENQRKGAKAIARSRGVFMIVDHLSSSLNLFRIVTIYLWFSNLICFALQVSHTIRTFILYWGGYIYQGYLSDICTHMQTSKHILLCSF